MAGSGVVITKSINQLISERGEIWDRFEKSQSQAAKLQKLSGKIPAGEAADIPLPLTSEDTPAAETRAALEQLEEELAKISQAQTSIQQHRAEIAQLEKQQKIIMAVAALAVIIVLTFAAFQVFGL